MIPVAKVETSLNIYTPRGTYVPNTVRSDGADDPWQAGIFDVEGTDNYYRNAYPQATILSSSTRTYNCHSYAWANGYTNRTWINTPGDDLYFQNSPGDGSYDYVSENVATHVSYSGDHSAVTTSTTNIYKSKWGAGPLMQHNKYYCPSGYQSPNLFHRRSIDVPSDFSTISSAMSNAASGQTCQIISSTSSSGTVSIPSGVELKVNSGAILTVQSGSTINFSNTAKFNIYGTLNATNSTFNFTAQNSSLQNGIRCYYPASTNISGCTISNAWYGIALDNYVGSHVTNTNITNCRYGYYAYNSTPASDYGLNISNCYYGIYLYNCPAPATMIGGNNIHNNTIGISLYNSDAYLLDNEISYNSYHGVYCSSGSDAKIEENNIHHNSYQGVYCYNNSYPNLGYEGPYEYMYGWNSIEQNSSHNVHSEVSGVIWALQNWWGSNPPPTNKFYAQNGTIAYTPYLTSPPSMQENLAVDDGNNIQAETSVSSKYSKPVRILIDAMNLIIEKKYV